jgi:hypothetical protein
MDGELQIKRTGGWSDRRRAREVLVDGSLVGEVRANETKTVRLPSGAHTFRLKID